MTAYTDFHYSPTGSGVISGSQVLEQTEQGINGLGQYVQDNVSGAIDTANQALTIAQTADTNATLALNTANSFASAISAANNTANNALTTAQSAQNTANSASSLATTANNNANTALNAANTATANVGTLTNSVNALGNRMTTAENAISTNAGNITTLQTNLQTTNNNVTAAANAASAAQATATSAQSTATLARNQAYVLRYTGTTITGGGTIAYADIDNTDNIKAGDKIIDVTGDIYRIASVDIANETVTVDASDVIHLATDSDVVHKSGNENIGGKKTFTDSVFCKGSFFLWTNANVVKGTVPQTTIQPYRMYFGDAQNYASSLFNIDPAVGNDGTQTFTFRAAENVVNGDDARFALVYNPNRTQPRYLSIKGGIEPSATNTYDLGSSSYQWNNLYAKNYYYNGVAWGLDKANTWSETQIIKQQAIDIVNNPSARINGKSLYFSDGTRFWSELRPVWNTDGSFTMELGLSNYSTGGTQGYWNINANISKDFSTLDFYTSHNNANLGTSTNKWKSLNGINPGALSLPGEYTSSVTEYITDKTGGNNNVYTAPADGWVGIQASSATLDSTNFVFMGRTSDGTNYYAQNASSPINAYWSNLYHGCILLPVISGKTYGIRCKCDIVDARFYKANGNVS